MTEEFLQCIWKQRLYNQTSFKAYTGEKIEIIEPGIQNTDSGPDFFNARVKINDTEWAGNIEIHIKASDWKRHKHNNEKAYDNVILHMVENYDADVFRSNDERIPVARISYDPKLFDNYQKLIESRSWIACHDELEKVDSFVLNYWLMSLVVERISDKSKLMVQCLDNNKNDWEESFYTFLARNFGFKLNSLPFELLAKSLPLKVLLKHRNSLLQTEALLFGQAGFLDEESLEDEYTERLKKEYNHLRYKFRLRPIEKHLWKSMRTRPDNFPTIRIAQFAALIHKTTNLFSKVLALSNVKETYSIFDISASEYWKTHSGFGKESNFRDKKIGRASIDIITINTLVPFIFLYGKTKDDQELTKKALDFLEDLKPEKNSIISHWGAIGITAKNAWDSQALLQLKNNYCEAGKCLQCQVGIKLINRYT